MPPVALRKLLAYYGHHTHWTERVEHYLLHLLYYCVNSQLGPGAAPVSIDKLQAAITRTRTRTRTGRGRGRGDGGSPVQDDETALFKAEEIAGAYGKY